MLASLLVAGCVLLGQVSADADRELSAQVRRLVRQLDSNELAERQEAERALIELGAGVLEKLPRITPRTPAEVKERLERVVQALEKAAAASVGKASRVTLQGEMPLAEAMRSLEEQTGNVVVGYENRDGTIKADFDDIPYWEALDQVLDQAQLTINPYGGKVGALTVQARPEGQSLRYGRASYSGPFRFEATRVQAQRDLRNPRIQGMRVTVEVSWEPRTTPIFLAQPLRDVSAVDEDGVSVDVDGEGVPTARVNADIASVELDLPFVLPEREVEKIDRLRGKLMAVVPGRVEAFEFTDLPGASNVEQKKAAATVTLERLRKNQDLFEVRMRLRYDEAANALESHRGWVYNNDAFLIDAEGNRVDNAGLQATRQEPNEVGVAYLFALEADPKNYKFVYRTPVAILNSQVEYELRDIPLP